MRLSRKALLRSRHQRGLIQAAAAIAVAGCGSMAAHSGRGGGIPPALLHEMRPIGRGARFQPPVRGPVIGPCRRSLGHRYGAHLEVFAANRVVIIPAGIGAAPPIRSQNGRITGARCYGAIVTLQPTGVVLLRTGGRTLTVGDLFHSWGNALGRMRLASFTGAVRAFVAGRRVGGPATRLRLTPHAEVVLEIGPYVPPHRSFTFPPGT